LNWTSNDSDAGDTIIYDVYLGITTDPPQVATGEIEPFYTPELLNYSQTYHWKIVATDGQDTVESPLWEFTTAERPNNPPYEPHNPVPYTTAVDVPTDVGIVWLGGDPDPGDTVTYDIYFGVEGSPPLVETAWSDTWYEPDALASNTTYYWKIDAHDDHGHTTPGPIWHFTTELEVICGDVNNDDIVNVGDVVYLITYLYRGGSPPDPVCKGDVNCDDIVNIGDVVYLITYLYRGGPAPTSDCCT
jgi:hypothetical protein